MDETTIRASLVKLLREIQELSGLPCPTITGNTKPLEDIPQFDSKIWPVAIGMLAVSLGVTIASDINIFRGKASKRALTVDETVATIAAVAKPLTSLPPKAATR